jgi:hypothetical protein
MLAYLAEPVLLMCQHGKTHTVLLSWHEPAGHAQSNVFKVWLAGTRFAWGMLVYEGLLVEVARTFCWDIDVGMAHGHQAA